jgi:hypothetical protein
MMQQRRSGRPPGEPDDGYGFKDAWAAPIEPYEQRPVGPTQMQTTMRRALLQDVQLVPQGQDFGFQPLWRPETVAQHAEKQEADCNHSVMMF